MTTENPLSKTFLDAADAMGINQDDFKSAVQSILGGTFDSKVEDRMDVSSGGLLYGPGTETSDSIPAVAPVGTFILNAEAVRRIGADRLGSLIQLARTKTWNCRLSKGEYVVPPYAVAALGLRFWNSLNDAGNLLREEYSPDPEAHQALLVQFVEDAIVELGNSPASGGEARAAGGGIFSGLGQAARGFVPVAMQLDQREKDNARADQALEIQRESHVQGQAIRGIELQRLEQQQKDDDALRNHTKAWGEGRKKILNGDYADLVGRLIDYNNQVAPFDNDHVFRYENTPEGKYFNHLGPDGTVLEKFPVTRENALKLYDLGMAEKLRYLSPEKFEEARKTTAAAAEKSADRQNKKEVAKIYADGRMYGAEVGADAEIEAAEIRALRSNHGPKGLTTAQQRTNDSIFAARRQLTGMTQDDVLARTQSHTATGRENPNYDPSLARAVKLAQSRLYGDDPAHDTFTAGRQQQGGAQPKASTGGAKQTPLQAAQAALTTDPNMSGYTLGEQTTKGFKVLDSNGQHVGFYGRAR